MRRSYQRLELLTEQSDLFRAAQSANAYERRLALVGTEAARPSLERIIVTETSQAFNEAARQQAAQIERDTGVELIRVWSAESGACEECAGLDGTTVSVNEPFPGGEPGDIHPNCRCIDEIRVKS